jgi:hypothetical protein
MSLNGSVNEVMVTRWMIGVVFPAAALISSAPLCLRAVLALAAPPDSKAAGA